MWTRPDGGHLFRVRSAMLMTVFLATAAVAFAVIYKPRPVVQVAVRRGDAIGNCADAIRQALARGTR